MKVLKGLVFIILAAFSGTTQAQVSSKGKLFYFSFMEMLTVSTTGAPDSLLVFMTCDVNTKVTIDNPRVFGSAFTMNLVAGQINRYSADPTACYPVGSEFGSSSAESKKCIRITAKDPISVYCLNMEVVRTDGTFVLPYEAIPKAPEFYIAAFTPNRTEGSSYMPSEFVIVGMDNNVQVQITPTTRTSGGKAAGTPFTVTLSRGQVYQVQSHPSDGNTGNPTDPAGDLTGTRVRVINGCGKINVFSGMRTAKMPASSCSTIDHLYTQVFPTSILGTEHVLMPFSTQTGGYVYKVIATKPNTKIYVDGTYIGSTRAAGKYYYEDVTSAVAKCITSDSPVYVVQFMKSSGCSGNSSEGDPAILIMPDLNQKMLKATVGTATTANLNKHYINILVAKSAKNVVKLNGTLLSSTRFTDIPCANHSYAQIAVSNPSSNTVECDSGLIVVAYGAGPTESYSYCAGALFENLEFDVKMTRSSKCPNYPVTLQAITNAKNVKKYIWKFGDGFTDTGKTVVHSYKQTGSFYTVVYAIVPAACGGNDTMSRSMIVNIMPGPLYDIPDTIFQCAAKLNVSFKPPVNPKYIYKWQDSSTGQTYTSNNPEKVWLKITDTSTNCFLFDSSVLIRYNPVKAGISYDTVQNCLQNNFYSLSDKSSFNGDTFKSARWSLKLPPSGKDSSQSKPRFRFSSDTVYSYPLYYYLLSVNGCRDTLRTDLIVRGMPTAVLQTSFGEYCQKEDAIFGDSSYGEGGISQTYWNFGDGSTDSGKIIKHKFLTYDTFKVRMVTQTIHGCTDTADTLIVIHPLPIMGMSVMVGDACKKSNDFSFSDGSSLAYGTMANSWKYLSQLITSADTIKNISFPDTGYWNIKILNTTDRGCTDSLTRQVYVAPDPVVRINVTDSSICFKRHYFDLEDASTLSRGTFAPRKWTFSDGAVFTSKTVLKKKFVSFGTYSAKLVVTTAVYGCKDSVMRDLTVLMSPKAPFKVNDSSQCLSGNIFQFSPVAQFQSGAITATHNWNFGDLNTGNTENITHSYAAPGTYLVRYIIKTSEGCADTATAGMFVDSTPLPAFTPSKDSVCAGAEMLDFVNNSVFSGGFISRWDLGDGTKSNSKDVLQKNYSAAGNYIIKLLVISPRGCRDSTTHLVTVMAVPKAGFSINNPVQCLQGNNFIFTNSSTGNGATGLRYKWVFIPGAVYNTQNISNQNFSDTGNYSVKLFLQSAFGCADSVTKSIYVAETPVLTINSDAPACQGEIINFTAAASMNSGIIAGYNWNFGDGNSSAIQNPGHAYSGSGVFDAYCTVTSGNGCSATQGPIAVTVHPRPVADFISEQLDTRGMETDHKLTFTGYGATGYDWRFYDGRRDYTSGPVLITFNDTGYRPVTLWVVNGATGCVDSITKNMYLKPELQMWISLSFSPNGDGLNEIFGPSTVFGLSKFNMRIYNRWGEQLFESDNPAKGWDGTTSNGVQVPEGVYAYRINFRYIDGKIYVYKGTVTVLR